LTGPPGVTESDVRRRAEKPNREARSVTDGRTLFQPVPARVPSASRCARFAAHAHQSDLQTILSGPPARDAHHRRDRFPGPEPALPQARSRYHVAVRAAGPRLRNVEPTEAPAPAPQ